MPHSPFRRRLPTCLRDRRGATSIEYGLVCVLIAIAAIAGIAALGRSTAAQIERVDGQVADVLK